MSLRLLALLVVLGLFGTLTTVALLDVGYLGILLPQFRSWGAGQVLADLTIVCTLGCVWMVSDARTRGLKAWPFVVLTLIAGSFGLLGYLVMRELKARRSSPGTQDPSPGISRRP